jgi:hypothetical protein
MTPRLSHFSFSASDGKDGDVTSKVIVTGWASRDTSVIGKQVLTYTVTDTDSNVAFTVRFMPFLLIYISNAWISCAVYVFV